MVRVEETKRGGQERAWSACKGERKREGVCTRGSVGERERESARDGESSQEGESGKGRVHAGESGL